ncbi:MAG: NAD(P)/FAD-dependent oxidoreductase, partial [Halioglobus sp.]|nr:NAD(P)/FAD-dependent oxidoreductase [Halioglobus sp.]
AIQHPAAALVTDGIAQIEADGIRSRDGTLHPLDVIVYATGFHADAFMRPMQVIGRNGADLAQFWAERPRAYLAISMPDFPNFFMLNGPNGPVGNFSLIDIAEHQWGYINQLMERLAQSPGTEICPRHDVLDAFEVERIAAAKKTVWFTGGCHSWYLDTQGIPASWPWSYQRFVDEMSAPRWECFEPPELKATAG